MRKRFPSAIRLKSAQSGFTLIELLIVIVIVGILATMTLFSWNSALSRWHVSSAQQQIALAIRQTQIKAQGSRANWQFSIYETAAGSVEWASHPQKNLPKMWKTVGRRELDIDQADTTLDNVNGIYYIRFDYKGNLASRTRTLTLTNRNASNVKRCLIMSTILGEIRLANEQSKPNSKGRRCY